MAQEKSAIEREYIAIRRIIRLYERAELSETGRAWLMEKLASAKPEQCKQAEETEGTTESDK